MAKTKLATLAFLYCGEMVKNSITLFTFKSPLPPSCPVQSLCKASTVFHSITLHSLHHAPFHHPAQSSQCTDPSPWQPPSCPVQSPCKASFVPSSITLQSLHHATFHHPAQPPSCSIPSPCTTFTMHRSITLTASIVPHSINLWMEHCK